MPRVDYTTGEVLPSILDTLADSEELLAKRREIVTRVSPLRALYGGQGYFGERVFKLDEAKIDTAIRTQLRAELKQGEKMPTEGHIDALVRQQPTYVAALMAQVERRAEWIALEEELNEIEWRLKLRTSDSYLLGAEAKLS
jgi:hypothetical protein